MEQFEHLALSTYLYTGQHFCYRYVEETFVVPHSDESDDFWVTFTQLT